ncbi:MAG: flagellar assembly protein FliW [FCB group bacterium]|nr:flagellar assembly protein FliW [FCB group bacterium]
MTQPQTSPLPLPMEPDHLPNLGWDFEIEVFSRAHFKFGLPGFEHLSQFVIASVKDFPPFHILISKAEPEVNLLIINTQLLSIYQTIDIPVMEFKKIGTSNREDVDSYVVVKVNAEKNTLTVNLRAPILIHKNTLSAYQAILDRRDLSIEYPLIPA